MIDDRICIFYIADRVESIVEGKSSAKHLLSELHHAIGINAREKRKNPDALTADLPPIDPPKKRGRPRK